MADKVLIAKHDIYAEIDNGYGQPIKQLVARKGQEVPAALEEHVDKKDVTSELAKTRSLVGRSAAERRDLVDAERTEPAHADVRAAAAVTEPVVAEPAEAVAVTDTELAAENEALRKQLADAEEPAEEAETVQEPKKDPEKAQTEAPNKARKTAPNKARKGAKTK